MSDDPPRTAGTALSGLPPLGALPMPFKALLSVLLLYLAGGYAAALVNIYAQNELADGRPGLTLRDVIIRYRGAWLPRSGEAPPPSRMLEMIRGAMRQYLRDEEDYRVLVGWLAAGAPQEALYEGAPRSPADVLLDRCMRCHAADSGTDIAARSPFGPDLFTLDYERLARLAAPAQEKADAVRVPPRDWRGLVLSTHAHALAVPMFLLVLGGLFLWTGWPGPRHPRWRAVLGSAPLALFLLDMSAWWLARVPVAGALFVLLIPVSGALFGLAFAVQWLVVARALWWPGAGGRS